MVALTNAAEFPIPQFVDPDRSGLLAAVPRLEAIFRAVVEQNRAPGLAYGIVADGRLIAAGGFGVQRVDDPTPVTSSTVLRIASMSKSFTAMAIVKLRDDGRLSLDAPAADYVPEMAVWRYPTRDTAPITVRQLLTMSAGFPEDNPWGDRQLDVSEDQFTEWLRAGLPFSNAPGVQYEYSNYGYGILGRIVTNVSGMAYQRYVTENILHPLGMTSTTYDWHAVEPGRLALGYRREDDAWADEPMLDDGVFGSMGGLLTSIDDFARYMAFLLSAFPPRDDEESGPIRRSSAREMQQAWRQRGLASSRATPDVPALVQVEGYGYGLASSIDSILGYWVAHGGGLPGFGSYYRLLPDCGVGMVLLTNGTYSSMVTPVHDAFVELKHSGALKPRTLAPSRSVLAAQESVLKLYERWDDDLARELAADNFFLGTSLEKRRAQFDQLRATFGKCLSVSPLEPENALRGRWVLRCENGRVEMFATLAPAVPPKLQYLEVYTAMPLSRSLKGAAARVIQLIAHWDDEKAKLLLARSVKRDVVRDQLDALRVQYGRLNLGEELEGDGQTQSRVRLDGDKGSLDLTLRLDAKSGKLTAMTFTRPRETTFVP